MYNIDKFLEVLETFKAIYPNMELPQMIYSTIVTNRLKNSDIYLMDSEEFIKCMRNAIIEERDEPITVQFEKEFTKKQKK